jgi:RecA-family ATPase
MFTELQMPIATLTHSGGKSLHAIVKVDAPNRHEYQKRFEYIQKVCESAGFTIDKATKDPSRLSRLPGLFRQGRKQFLMATNLGAASWEEWVEYIEGFNDGLPDIVSLDQAIKNLPPLKETLIDGILRKGHKMMLSSASKAGKTFLLMELCCALAEGQKWLGFQCRQSKVLYINFEVDDASCYKRFANIYKSGVVSTQQHSGNIEIWNLRGKSAPLKKLVPSIIRRCKELDFAAIILDPIYKISMGDENSAEAVSKFCNELDRIAVELGVSVIYCHHHSKGATGKYANAADRSSGSGVFARDPDAILDLREVNVDGLMDKYRADHPNACEVLTGWEVSGTLREFAPMQTKRVWFDYPLHVSDDNNYLGAATYNDSGSKGVGNDQKPKTDWFETVGEMLQYGSDTAVTLEQVGISESNAKSKFTKETDYEVATIDDKKVVHKRMDDRIVFGGVEYFRKKQGRMSKWLRVTS